MVKSLQIIENFKIINCYLISFYINILFILLKNIIITQIMKKRKKNTIIESYKSTYKFI